ncbi:MAG: ice-binding family protein [bacterium]|nr:ice-binding family protein [bacterium]
MNIFHKSSVVILTAAFALGLITPISALAVAATAPNLLTSASFSVFAGSSMSADGSGATISGDLGVNPGLAVSGPWTVGGTRYFGTGGLSGTAKTDATAAWTSMSEISQPGGTAWDPAVLGDQTPAAGLYTRAGSATITTTITLNGTASDVWIFQITDDMTFAAGATVVLGAGVNACNVYWRIARDATINGAPGNTFRGTLIANRDVSLLTGATVVGRMFALTGSLTTAGVTNISGCASPTFLGSSGARDGFINVVKLVINNSGGTKTVADFPLFVNGQPVVSGVTKSFPAPATVYNITETGDSNYVKTFSGGCDVNGQLNLNPGSTAFCVVTNDDIGPPVLLPPPLIDVLKVPSPLALPNGPGPVAYTYLLSNVGIVPVTNVTMVGDTCSPIILKSGDTNNDAKLDVNETWVYSCSTNLTSTHTNIVTATGLANGITAVDTASATVVVGSPLPPPLIHVVKKPNVFVLANGGGAVTYTYTVTNPGTAPLNNVIITDDKCTGLPGRVLGNPGDVNQNNLLESNEAWLFTCQTNLTQTTTNVGTALGSANGLTAIDFSPATVVVSPPKLPNTGFGPDKPWNIIMLAGIVMLVSASLLVVLRKRLI